MNKIKKMKKNKKLKANYTFDLETWNIQGQGNRQRSGWKELIKVYLTAVTPTDRPKSVRNSCVIKVFGGVFMLSRCFLDCSVGVGVFVTGLSQISSFFSYLHLKCENVVDHGVGTVKLNTNCIFDLETWNIQGKGYRQRSRWKELIKIYLHLKC